MIHSNIDHTIITNITIEQSTDRITLIFYSRTNCKFCVSALWLYCLNVISPVFLEINAFRGHHRTQRSSVRYFTNRAVLIEPLREVHFRMLLLWGWANCTFNTRYIHTYYLYFTRYIQYILHFARSESALSSWDQCEWQSFSSWDYSCIFGEDEGCKIYNLAARANFESEALEEPRIKVCNLATERER